MTNKQRQRKLDEIKYLQSEIACEDLSGKMSWCNFCENQSEDNGYCSCKITQQERECVNICAKAYNRMIRNRTNH